MLFFNNHVAKDCDVSIQCTECGSNKHVKALHPGPLPWTLKAHNTEHGGEKESANPSINSKCTEVCWDNNSSRSCSKICLIRVHPKGDPDKSLNVYAIFDDQSNRSLARSEFFDLFNLKSTEFPYTLCTSAGVTEMSGRRAMDFIAHPLDGNLSVPLPTLIECNYIPENRSEIPTPEAAKHHPHLKSIAHLIPPLDPNAQILLLLGCDILQVHKVRDQRTGPQNAPYAQRLDLGWVVVGEVCLSAAHKPSTISVYRTNVLEDGRPSCFSPCLNKLYLKEKLTAQPSVKVSLLPQLAPSPLATSVFERTKDDEKIAPSVEDRQFIQLMDKEMFMDDTNSWVAPLPFRSPKQHLPNNREQAQSRFNSLCRTLRKKPEMREHFVEFMQRILDNDHAELVPPVNPGRTAGTYLPSVYITHASLAKFA
ncbi:uncharacterized protein LOC128318568 isoform X1 [Pangasianodon hypophthalmus]|uniref:uncharacterized protein LOC128318568 isoform X1 n=1 Tax=Pangasianodon hypophthalmus TaxID=310915 RepID=UPI0023073327|nr:uncharacterized protein LOC128318568 isoform X1 [Pangasianodon hypophthalmus]XP_053091229.1 uncharacterized protein LOC128318568 isoform X1 [Pangasianodon hypophthalmus]XP_053091230.1 uncharacterized protein LOC128318568 isoform X1 [Pangasianodon hypophthalmus]